MGRGWAVGGGGLRGRGGAAYKAPDQAESWPVTARSRFPLFFLNITRRKTIKKILNGLQKSRNKFSSASKNRLDKVNIYLGLNAILKTHIFPNSNKIAIKLRIKILFDFNIKSLIFLYFEEVILSSLFYFYKRNI